MRSPEEIDRARRELLLLAAAGERFGFEQCAPITQTVAMQKNAEVLAWALGEDNEFGRLMNKCELVDAVDEMARKAESN